MNQLFRAAAAICAAAIVALAPARAELPKVLDHVSPDAVAVIATPNLGKLDANASQLTAVMGMPQLVSLRQAMQMVGIRDGVNFDGSMAIVLLDGDMDAPVPPAIAIIPTSNHASLMQGFGATTDGAISSFSFNGEQVFATQMAGGYTVMGPVRELVAGYGNQRGHMATHRQTLGRAGIKIAERSDVMMMAAVEALTPAIEGMINNMREGAQMAAAMGAGDPDQMEAGLAAMEGMLTTVKEDGRSIVGGVTTGALGLGFDMGVVFRDGTDSAAMFQRGGRAGTMLARLPGSPFMLAGAVDMQHPMMRAFFKGAMDMQAAQQEALPGVFGALNFNAMMEDMKGQAWALYPNPAGPMAGLLANTIIYTEVGNPKHFVEQTKEMFGKITPGPENPMQGVFTSGVTEINGHSVDGWELRLDQTNPMAGQMMMGMNMVFGPGGLNGYLMATDSGVYQTLSKNSQLLRDAIGAGRGASMADHAMIKQIGERMPSGRVAEGYLNLKPILDQVMPFVMMFGMPPLDVPAELPPIGGGLASEDGAMVMSGFVPAQVLKLGASIAEQVQDMAPPGGQGGGGGRPRF
ncbi:MAG: hypothetical protein EA376_00530 [Phycisphaeraceae bacterium]|nr:MAG: hypothetical protein EA376_00530 [Phycisphaeraceae bacterium]